jgi:hypothetical protein
MEPPLLSSRSPAQQIVVGNVVPAIFGLITGIMAGVSAPIYLLLSVLGIGGGFFAGLEHRYTSEGLLRGIAGGLLFGTFILLGRAVTGLDDKADIPPAPVLLIITTGLGAALGAWGASRRAKRHGPPPPAATAEPIGGV